MTTTTEPRDARAPTSAPTAAKKRPEPRQRSTLGVSAAPAAASSDRGRDTQPPTDHKPANPYPVRAKHLLKTRGLWTIPVIVGAIVLVLVTVFYIGSVVNPISHLRGLPVSLVNEDAARQFDADRARSLVGEQLDGGLARGCSGRQANPGQREQRAGEVGGNDQHGVRAVAVHPVLGRLQSLGSQR